MVYLRTLILLLSLLAGGWHLEQERRAGSLVQADAWFLDFLVGNARERLTTPMPDAAPAVALIRLRTEQRAEYESWPPSPLDWQMLLKGLSTYQPELLVIATPLTWGSPEPAFIPALADALLAFPSVALGIQVEWAASPQGAIFLGEAAETLPRLNIPFSQAQGAPALKGIVTPPHPSLRGQAEMGLMAMEHSPSGWQLPYFLLAEEAPLPSLLAQALTRHTHTPYSQQRLRLGPGAGTFLNQGRFIPLEADGSLLLTQEVQVPEINALDLMTSTLADAVTPEAKATLSQAKVLVIGLDGPGTQPHARTHAQALAWLLSLPTIRQLSHRAQWALWATAALAAAWLALATPRQHALRTGLGLLFILFVTSLLLFQSALIWFPPAIPAFALLIGALTGRLLGRSSTRQPPKAPNTPNTDPATA